MGELVANRFEILGLAGQGAMARVYRARDRQSDTLVALKIAPENEHLPRFTEEAAALASLNHPSLVRYVAHGSLDTGAYLAMDWVEGQTLAQRLLGEPLGLQDVVDLGIRLARALGTAHAHGVLHRDVKPSNVMLRSGDLAQPVLVDFGLAHRPGRVEITASGVAVGTLGYMSPEQVRGDKGIDARVDVFAIGCVMFRAITGRAPFVGNQPLAILAKILLEPTPHVRDLRSDVPDELDDAIATLMSLERSVRPLDGTAAAEMLESVSLSRPSQMRERAIGSSERRIVSVVVVGVGAQSEPSIEIASALESFDARVEPLPNGALVAMLTGNAMDQALRAGRSALRLRERFPAVPIALATGHEDVTAGVPIGSTIDRAVRLLDPGGGVRIDDATADLVDARFEVRTDGERLTLENERTVFVSRKLLGKDTPFVGRDREMAMLVSAVHESFRDSAALCTLVTAAAGTGKSRLRHELYGRIRRELPNLEIWIARGDPLRAGSPFDIVGQLVGGTSDAIGKVAGRHFAGEKLQRVTEFLCEMAGAPLPGEPSGELRAARRDHELMRDQIRRAFAELVAAETGLGPRLLLIDDLHWGDLASVRLIEHALRSTPDAPLCVIAFARADVHETFPKIWEDVRVTELRLSDLSRRATEGLARDMLGQASAEVIARLVELSGGNAFYLEELIRGAATGRTSELPTSIVAMSESRLDQLDGDLKRTLRAASVFGMAFWEDAVRALLGDAAPRASDWLRNAEAMELVHRRGESRFPNQVEYAFRHALIREAAYVSLTEDDRKVGHGLAAHWLEAHGEADPLVMAEHWERAGQRDRAIPHVIRLAEQALKATDTETVLQAARRAKALGAAGIDLGRAELAAAEAAMWGGPSGVDHALAAFELLPEGSAPWLRAAATMGVLASRSNRHELHAPLRERMARVILSDASSADVIAAGAQSAFAITVAFRDAPDLFDLLLPHRSIEEPFARAALEHAIFMRAALNGRARSKDMHALRDAIAPLEARGGARVAHLYRANLAYAERMLGLIDDAERDFRLLEQSVQLVRARMFALHNLGVIAFMREQWDVALRCQEEALTIVQADVRIEAGIRVQLARLHLRRGAVQSARDALAPINPEALPPNVGAITFAAHACIALAEGSIEDAVSFADRGLAIATEGIDGELFVHATHLETLLKANRQDDARAAARVCAKLTRERAARLDEDSVHWLAIPDHARLLALADSLS